MNLKKIFGWILLLLGLAMIITALYFSYMVFIGKMQAPEIFKNLDENKAEIVRPAEQDLEKIVEEQIKDMVPSEFVAQLLNLISWSIFAGILIFGGSKLAGIGIRLARRET